MAFQIQLIPWRTVDYTTSVYYDIVLTSLCNTDLSYKDDFRYKNLDDINAQLTCGITALKWIDRSFTNIYARVNWNKHTDIVKYPLKDYKARECKVFAVSSLIVKTTRTILDCLRMLDGKDTLAT